MDLNTKEAARERSMPQKYGKMGDLCAVLGLYIHIPFCRHACHYCNFHFSTQLQHSDAMVSAIAQEIDLHSNNQTPLSTLYFGGGSPSVLTPQELQRIFTAIHRNFDLSQTQEITLEANPEDLTPSNLETWKLLGINRLSIGIQSLNDEELSWMNRKHSAAQSLAAVALAATYGFHDVSIDLIYGSEKKSLSQWKAELEWANTDIALPKDRCSRRRMSTQNRISTICVPGQQQTAGSITKSATYVNPDIAPCTIAITGKDIRISVSVRARIHSTVKIAAGTSHRTIYTWKRCNMARGLLKKKR